MDAGRTGITHQSAKFTLTGNRVFNNQGGEVWDLSDSLAELYETAQRHEGATHQLAKRGKAGMLDKNVDVKDWIKADNSHGFIRVYVPGNTNFTNSHLIPLTLSTSAHQVCLKLGITINALHVQINGDIIRRLDPYEHPLVIQNDYLSVLGFTQITRIQEEGAKEELGYLIRFYAGTVTMYMYISTFYACSFV